jgi:outer membrane protein assembly factor BamB
MKIERFILFFAHEQVVDSISIYHVKIMKWRFMKYIMLMMVVVLLLFPNLYGNITGTSMNDIIDDYSRDIILNASRANNGLANSPWPMFGHDLNHTGKSQYSTSKNNGQKKWAFTTGNSVSSSPSIGPDGTIYFGSGDKKLYALYPNGTKKWDFVTGDDVDTSPAIGSDGTIYVGSGDNKLYAIYPNGMMKWVFGTGSHIWSSPVIGLDGTIYFGSYDDRLYALYPNGTKKWDFITGDYIYSSPSISSDGTIYIDSNDGKLYALFSNGTKRWDFFIGSSASSPAIGSDGTIYVGSIDNHVYALNSNGTKKWEFATGAQVSSSPAISLDGTIYVSSSDEKLYSIYPNGTKKWEFGTGGVASSSAIGSDGTIYFGSFDNKIYALYPNGTKKWDFATGIYVTSSPAIGSDGTIYIGSWDNKLYAIGTTPPTPPQNLTAVEGNAYVDLTWTVPSDNGGPAIINYTIYRGTISGSESYLTKVGNTTSYRDSIVKNGQKYYYGVTASNAIGESPKSNEANATPKTIPTAPEDLTAVPGNAQIALNWIVPADNGGASITSYTVYRNGSLLKVLGNVFTFTDTGLVNGVNYLYNISATNNIGEGPKSIGVIAFPRTVPTAPRGLRTIHGKSQIDLIWIAPANNGGAPITNYSIYRGTKSGCETLFVKGYIGGTSWIDTNTSLGIMYYYMVSAINVAGEGPRSYEENATPFSVPGAPRLTVIAGASKVTLSWTVPSSNGASIMNYSVYRGTASGCETLFVKGYTDGTSWIDTNVIAGTKYYYLVSAVNAAGEGLKSNETSITAGNSPNTPLGLTPTGGNSQVLLRWSEPKSGGIPDHYNIYRSESKTGKFSLIGVSYTTKYKDTGLTNGHEYWYKINAQNDYGVSANTTITSTKPYETNIISIFILVIIVIIIVVLIIVEATRSSRGKKPNYNLQSKKRDGPV